MQDTVHSTQTASGMVCNRCAIFRGSPPKFCCCMHASVEVSPSFKSADTGMRNAVRMYCFLAVTEMRVIGLDTFTTLTPHLSNIYISDNLSFHSIFFQRISHRRACSRFSSPERYQQFFQTDYPIADSLQPPLGRHREYP